jgi:hypothetical protein
VASDSYLKAPLWQGGVVYHAATENHSASPQFAIVLPAWRFDLKGRCLMIFELALVLCTIPMMIGGLSGSPSKAALYAGVVMALVVVIVLPASQVVTESKFESATIQALAVIPAAMVLGLIGQAMRWGLGRMRSAEPRSP